MSVFVPVANAAQFELGFVDVNGDFQENSIWVKNSVPWTDATLDAMADGLVTWYGTGDGAGHSYQAIQSHHISLTVVSWRDNTTIGGLSSQTNVGLPLVGGIAAAQLPAGLSFPITTRTGLAGKSHRGRVFVCGLQVGAVPTLETNVMDSGTVTDLVLAFTSLIAAVTANLGTATWVVVSRFYQPGGPNTPSVPRAAGVTTPITAVGFHDNLVAFQRRRAPGHARHH